MLSEPTTAAEVLARARQTAAWRKSIKPVRQVVQPKPAPVVEAKRELPPAPVVKPVVIPYTLACALAHIGRKAIVATPLELEGPPDIRPTIRDIIAFVADRYGFTSQDIESYRRTRDVAWARMVGYALCKRLTIHSLPEIGRRFGGRDHTSILSGIRRVEALSATSADFRYDLEAMCRELAKRAKERADGRLR